MAGMRAGRDHRQMLDSVYSVIALVFILVACVELGDAATVVDVYRLIQYDLAGAPFGSRLAGLNHHAGSLHFPPGADLSRTVVMVPIREVNLTTLSEYITNKQPLGGLLLLLPQKLTNGIGGETKEGSTIVGKDLIKSLLADLEQLLVHASIPVSAVQYPVYFAFEDDNINDVLADVKRNDAAGQPATATTGGKLNFKGWLPGMKSDGDTSQLPTIAIVASYDTFGAAPALSVGSDSNGSGVVALLEIVRLFSRLYSNPKTRGRYNLLFGLTSGGPYNYNGTQKGFSSVAEDLGVRVGIKHKKINISNPRVAWEHEQFSRSRITAITLSELSAAPELLESTGGLYDSRLLTESWILCRHFANETAIFKAVKLVAESLAELLSSVALVLASNLAVNPSYISSWLALLSRTPRVAPFLAKSDPFITALKKELSDHTAEVNLQHEMLDGMFSFYDLTKAQLNIYQVASVAFDLLFLLVLGSYLIVLFSFLVITTRGLDDLISIFRRPPSRKVKIA
ncbi:hypothetical protein ACLOJK_020800 [Asimina triloba]